MEWFALFGAAVIILFIGPIGEIAGRQFVRMFGMSLESGARFARACYLAFAILLIIVAIRDFLTD